MGAKDPRERGLDTHELGYERTSTKIVLNLT